MMKVLDTFEGGENLVFSIPEPPSHKHDAWTKGVNRASGNRSLRIVMPLAMALEIVQHANLAIFTEQAGVECWPGELSSPEETVYFLNGKWDKFEMMGDEMHRDVPRDERKIHCKTIELPLNYHQRMVRYTFRVPPATDAAAAVRLDATKWQENCKRYLAKWMDLIVAEKRRQMHAAEDMWPPWPPRGEVKDVYDMPMVMWLSKPKTKKACKRDSEGHTRPADGGSVARYPFGMRNGDY